MKQINNKEIYWYDIVIRNGTKNIDYSIPVKAFDVNHFTGETMIEYLSPSTAQVEYKTVKNDLLRDIPKGF